MDSGLELFNRLHGYYDLRLCRLVVFQEPYDGVLDHLRKRCCCRNIGRGHSANGWLLGLKPDVRYAFIYFMAAQ